MKSRLPYSKVVIKYKDLAKTKKYKNLMGHMEFNYKTNKYEILIDSKSPEELQQLTRVHEMVHVRRYEDGRGESKTNENETEIEAIARTSKVYLTQAERILHDFLVFNSRNKKKPLNPNKPKDLKIILKRIKKIVVK